MIDFDDGDQILNLIGIAMVLFLVVSIIILVISTI